MDKEEANSSRRIQLRLHRESAVFRATQLECITQLQMYILV